MKSKIFILSFTILLIFGQIIFGQEKGVGNRTVSKLPAKEKRWALIIGVSQYEDGNITSLPGAANDARALRDALREYAGFDEKQIILLTTDESKDRQPTKNNILRYLGNLSGTVPKDGLLLVAFSGHGIERQKQAFLMASDSPYNDNVKVLERTAISVSNDFKELIRDTAVGQVIILLDACRNDPSSGRSSSDNPLTQAYKDGFSFDVRNKEVEAFATLYATSIGERAYEYTRENKGYFTWAFIEGLKGGAANEAGEVTLGALIRYIEKYVPQQVKIDLGSNKLQRPFSIIEGYKAEELVLGIANSSRNNSLSSVQIAWNNFRGLAKTLLKYDNASAYSEGEEELIKIQIGESPTIKYGFVNKLGNEVTPVKYDQIAPFSEGLAEVNLNGKWGFIDRTGKVVTPLKYDETRSFSEGLASIKLNDKWGFIDKTGNEVIPPEYHHFSRFLEGLAGVELNGKFGFIDKTGKEVIPIKYDGIRLFSEGLAGIKLNNKWGFIDKTGKVIITPKYDDVYWFSEGLARIKLNDKWGFIDKTGKVIISIKYNDPPNIVLTRPLSFTNGLALVFLNDKLSFIDQTGKTVISLKSLYFLYLPFSEGFLSVGLNGKWGVVDKTGKEITPFKYDSVEQFSEGLATIRLNNKFGFIDKTGKEIIPPKYDYVVSFSQFRSDQNQKYDLLLSGDVIVASIDSKVGFFNEKGEVIIPFKYEKAWCSIKEGFIGVTLNGKKGFVDIYGNEYFDF